MAFFGGGDDIALSSLGQNGDVVAYMRSVGSIVGGSIAGILGLTGFSGALFYLLVSVAVSFALLLKAEVKPGRFFVKPWSTIFLAGVFERNMLLSYLLFWTFFYSLR